MLVVQVGRKNWQAHYDIPQKLEWRFIEPEFFQAHLQDWKNNKKVLAEIEKEGGSKGDLEIIPEPDLLLFTEDLPELDWIKWDDYFQAYHIAVSRKIAEALSAGSKTHCFLKGKMAMILSPDLDVQEWINAIPYRFFQGQYGEKIGMKSLQVSPYVKGHIRRQGNEYIELEGDFLDEFNQVLFWRKNLPYNEEPLDFWLEYEKDDTVSIQLRVWFNEANSSSGLQTSYVFSEQDMEEQVTLDLGNVRGYLIFSVEMKGEGKVKIGHLHSRYSRLGYGQFLRGGNRYADSKRDEFHYYFHPGNMKPPLTVYFSGFRTAEGFEGYWMMKELGQPFLLIGDPRLAGGAFYIGSEEYERSLIHVIKDTLNWLGFNEDQLILSGLSMGTYAALYYGADFSPYAIVVGKPLLNLGSMAEISRFKRPKDFLTSFDLVYKMGYSPKAEDIERFNQRVFNKLDQGDLSETTLAVAYMKQDDYDPNAYHDLLEAFQDKKTRIISKGLIGRHNDDSPGINKWFFSQYKRLIAEFSESEGDRNGS